MAHSLSSGNPYIAPLSLSLSISDCLSVSLSLLICVLLKNGSDRIGLIECS